MEKGRVMELEGASKEMLTVLVYKTEIRNKITNTKELYNWATEIFNKIYFDICTVEEFENHKKKLESRFVTAKTVKNTRAYHCYKPIDNKKIQCKVFSAANSDVVQQILK